MGEEAIDRKDVYVHVSDGRITHVLNGTVFIAISNINIDSVLDIIVSDNSPVNHDV